MSSFTCPRSDGPNAKTALAFKDAKREQQLVGVGISIANERECARVCRLCGVKRKPRRLLSSSSYGLGPQLGVTQSPSGHPPTVKPLAIRWIPEPSAFMMKRSKLRLLLSRSFAKMIFVPSGE